MERGMNNPHIYTGPSGGGEGAPQQHVTAPPAKGLTFHYASVQSYAPSPATSSTGDLSTVSEMAKAEDPLQYFVAGQQYSRQDIHDRYGAQRKGPVATPHDHWPYLFLFVRLRKEANAQWTDNVLYYTGEGKTGDMEWKGGNKVLREGAGKGKRILLFTLMERVASTAQFEGEVALQGIDVVDEPDREGNNRKAFVFRLAPVGWTYGGNAATSPTPGAAPAAPAGMMTRKRKQDQQAGEQQAAAEIKGPITRAKRQELDMLQKYEQQQQQHQHEEQGVPLPTSVINYQSAGYASLGQELSHFAGDASAQQFYHTPQQQQQPTTSLPAVAVKQEQQAAPTGEMGNNRPVDQVLVLAMMREAMLADKRAEELELCHATIVNALLHEPHKYVIQ